MTEYTPLLTRQLKRYLSGETILTPEWQALLDAINRSYEHYERDHLLGKQSLEISSQEQHQLTTALEEGRKWLLTIMDAAPDGILVVNEKNSIELCNHPAVHMLGLARIHDLVGKNANEILITKGRESINAPPLATPVISLASILAEPEQNGLYEMEIIRKNAPPLIVELSVSAVGSTEGILKICLLRNISKRKEAEKKVAVRSAITRLLLASNDLNEVGPKILKVLCTDLGWDVAFFWHKEREEPKVAYFFPKKLGDAQLEVFREESMLLNLEQLEVAKEIWKTRKPHFASFAAGQPVCKRLEDAQRYGFQNFLGFPIFFENTTFGMIELFSKQPHPQEPLLMETASAIGYEIGTFIERQNALARERALQKQLLEIARQAGMMQVASSVLHNVGNVLNSINISVSTLRETVVASELKLLPKVAEMLKEHQGDLASFCTQDDRGKRLPEFIEALAEVWEKEEKKTLEEIALILQSVQHIKNNIEIQPAIPASTFSPVSK